MRHLTTLLAAAASVLSTAPAYADLGDQLFKLLADDGVVFVTDAGNRRIRRIGTDGAVTTVAGSGERGNRDGPAGQASFFWPLGIAIDEMGRCTSWT